MTEDMYSPSEILRRAKQAIAEGVTLKIRPDGVEVTNRSKGTSYSVVNGKCSCPAGRMGKHCKHVSLVIYTKETAAGRRKVFDPVTPQMNGMYMVIPE